MAVEADTTTIPDSETSPNDAGLLPCPFCGGTAVIRQKGSLRAVQCENRELGDGCPVNLRTHYTQLTRVAADLWNTRAKVAS